MTERRIPDTITVRPDGSLWNEAALRRFLADMDRRSRARCRPTEFPPYDEPS